MFELYYSDGGHGGPYQDIFAALEEAKRRIAGSPHCKTIEIRPHSSTQRGGFARNNPGSIYIYGDGPHWRLLA